jgi:beta-carotene ketolase (CrtW type)
VKFFLTYFSWRQMVVLAAWMITELLLGAPVLNMLLFWALPALVSAVQLFLFGTWLPHRHGAAAFADEHRCRSSDFGWLLSLLSCFHFGYHREHHRFPHLPWWRLPGARRNLAAHQADAAA